MTDRPHFIAGSFRDRGARVFQAGDGIFRAMTGPAAADWRAISQKPFYESLLASQELIASRELTLEEWPVGEHPPWTEAILSHDRIPFVSYPYEWCFSMLREAALLHLRILASGLDAGVILKDATPYNVQFRGSQPVFIDVGSFIPHGPAEPWIGYRQFCELQLIPLLLQAYRGIDFQPLLRGSLEGLPVERARRWFSLRDLFRPGIATHVWLHGWLQRSVDDGRDGAKHSLSASGFSPDMIQRNVRRLTRLVERLRWTPPATTWTGYESMPHVAEDRDAKVKFVREVCQQRRRDLVWDFGCNRGQFSKIAAEHAATVVAMDADHGCIEQLFLELRDNGQANILPLVVELANSSPALGWRGRERLRLEDRGRPDLVLCLGLIHHLVISANIPLAEVVDWLADLGGELILEFPTKGDPLVRKLLTNKHDQYDDYTLEFLLESLRRRFDIQKCLPLPSGERFLFYASRQV